MSLKKINNAIKVFLLGVFAILALVALAAIGTGKVHAETIGSGTEQGHYYKSYAPNLAVEIGKSDRTFSGKNMLQVVATDGSLDNLDKTSSGEVQVSLTQPDAFMFFRSTEPNKANQIVLLGNVPVEECVLMVASENSKIKEFDDLTKDHTVNIGVPGSGSQASWAYFKKLIPALKDIRTNENSNVLALGDLQTGAADAMIFVTTKDRTSEVLEMVNAEDSGLRFVDLEDSNLNEKLPSGKPVYTAEKVNVEPGSGWPDKVMGQCKRLQVVANTNNSRKLNEAVVRAIIRAGSSVAAIRE